MPYATETERDDHFRATTFATYDFRVYDLHDNGEFLTFAKVDLIERGRVVHTEEFCCSSEDPYGPMSAYGSGRDNEAGTQARSYAWSWIESMETPLEVRLAPFGEEWQREMEEAYA